MAIAFGNASGLLNANSSLSTTVTPTTTPRGVLVVGVQDAGITTEVTSVTYAAVACSPIALSPLVKDAGTEDGVCYGYFLGSGIPGVGGVGQTIAITVDGTGSVKRFVVIFLTAAADTEVEDTSTLNSASVANPSVSLTTAGGLDTFCAGVLFSGQNAVGSVAPGADYTDIAEFDFSTTVASFIRRTTNGTGGAITVDWVAAAEKAGVLAVAIKEVSAGGGVVPVLMPQYRARWTP